MPDHDTTTPLPETGLDKPTEVPPSVALETDADAKTDKRADQTNDEHFADVPSYASADTTPHPVTRPVSLQGSGAVAAGQTVPLKVSAADPKAFGASLEDIATGRVGVSFTD
jgi:hypothetical protein